MTALISWKQNEDWPNRTETCCSGSLLAPAPWALAPGVARVLMIGEAVDSSSQDFSKMWLLKAVVICPFLKVGPGSNPGPWTHWWDCGHFCSASGTSAQRRGRLSEAFQRLRGFCVHCLSRNPCLWLLFSFSFSKALRTIMCCFIFLLRVKETMKELSYLGSS